MCTLIIEDNILKSLCKKKRIQFIIKGDTIIFYIVFKAVRINYCSALLLTSCKLGRENQKHEIGLRFSIG